MTKREAAAAKLTAAYEKILEAFDDLGYPVNTDANFTETAARAARAMVELVKPTDEIKSQIDEMLSRTFPAQYDEMVISKHNISFGMCPHHLLPVIYRISVAYLPGERVLGISKLSRIVHLLAHRPVLQEDLTQELAALLHERMETRGSAAYVEGCTCAWRRAASRRTRRASSPPRCAASSARIRRRARSSWTSSPLRK